MFSMPIFALALGAIIVIATLRNRSANAYRPPRAFLRSTECRHHDCRHVNRPFARFCSRCGRPLISSPPGSPGGQE